MSELTQCNYCSLREIRARAKKEGNRVTLLTGWSGGTDVFVHPPSVTRKELLADQKKDIRKYCVAWFMAIGDHCEC